MWLNAYDKYDAIPFDIFIDGYKSSFTILVNEELYNKFYELRNKLNI